MSLAVVRCPGCRGASRVSTQALGQMVGCPRCEMPFVAEEDIPIVQPSIRSSPRRAPVAEVAPAAPRRRLPAEYAPEPSAPTATEVPDPEHDPHARPVAGLPVSVLVGLALLPFGIPLIWRVAPFVTGQEAALSMAVPVSLAVAASALCLGVVYTIDWTATTRIKGVLMLVGLAYLSAGGLFFLKKDLMERIRVWGDDSRQWAPVFLKDGSQVRMPGNPLPAQTRPLGDLAEMEDERHSQFVPEPPNGPQYDYRFAVSKPNAGRKNLDEAWFARVGEKLQEVNRGRLVGGAPRTVEYVNGTCHEWAFEISSDATRVVRVYVIGDRVYYLHAEGPRLTSEDDEYGKPFFGKFSVSNK